MQLQGVRNVVQLSFDIATILPNHGGRQFCLGNFTGGQINPSHAPAKPISIKDSFISYRKSNDFLFIGKILTSVTFQA